MPIRAYISENFLQFSVDVCIVDTVEDGQYPARILRLPTPDRSFWEWEEVEPGAAVKPTLTLGHMEARALLDALHAHYSGVDDTRALRKDYDDERKRVDKLTESVADIAKSLAGKPYAWGGSGAPASQ